jgi:hypothetical protein
MDESNSLAAGTMYNTQAASSVNKGCVPLMVMTALCGMSVVVGLLGVLNCLVAQK